MGEVESFFNQIIGTPEKMQIQIKKLNGTKKPFDFKEEDLVSDIKLTLAEDSGIPTAQLRLIFKGAPMEDDKTLKHYQVEAGCVIHVISQLRGGC